MTEIRPVCNDVELAAVGRLRHRVYVEALGRHERHADHARRLVVEPADEGAHLFAAFDGDRAVGTLRGNIAAECDLGAYVSSSACGGSAPSSPTRSASRRSSSSTRPTGTRGS